jgi:hypothetical protein
MNISLTRMNMYLEIYLINNVLSGPPAAESRRALPLGGPRILAPLIFLDESAQVGLGGAAPRKLQED